MIILGFVPISKKEQQQIILETAYSILYNFITSSDRGYFSITAREHPEVEYRIYVEKEWEDTGVYFRVDKFDYSQELKKPN